MKQYSFNMSEDATHVQWRAFYTMMWKKYTKLIMRKLFVITVDEITQELVDDCKKHNVTIEEYVPPVYSKEQLAAWSEDL